MTVFAKVQFRFDAVHVWPDAPDGPEWFLRENHRHEFRVTVWVEQRHDDRDVEYVGLKRAMQRKFNGEMNLGHKSCEMIAKDVIAHVRELVGSDRAVRAEVLEDGENGAYVE
jgi:6-pyruvoyl-tetrahydropterin synthase